MDASDLTRAELVALANVSPRTAARWRAAGAIPEPYLTLLRARLGHLEVADRTWREWRLYRGKLWTPEGAAVTPGEIRALPHLLALAQAYDEERRRPRQYVLL